MWHDFANKHLRTFRPAVETPIKRGGQDKEALLASKVGPVLEFERISRDYNQIVYECLAQNTYGVSSPADVKLNVLYAPAVLNTSRSDSVQVGDAAQLACVFDGNPAPEIKWFYADPLSKSAAPLQVGNEMTSSSSSSGVAVQQAQNKAAGAALQAPLPPAQQHLQIRNVTYRNEGDYHCEARNQINGQVYSVRSSNIQLDVYGEPQFLAKSQPLYAKAVQGSKSEFSLTFCSDPPPNKVYWQFGSIRLDVK